MSSIAKKTIALGREMLNRITGNEEGGGSTGTHHIMPDGARIVSTKMQEMSNIKVPGCHLISVLGSGGMGTVFLARQENLDRLVAVKVLNSDLSAKPEFISSLLREARVMGGFSHPNLVNCHDVIQNKDGVFIIMEYIPGHFSGRNIVDELGMMPSKYIVRTLISVCRALEYIQERGFLHLDIKPDNLLFYRDNPHPPVDMLDVFGHPSSRVAICDFGIAMQLKGSDSASASQVLCNGVMGSSFYMAPEQISDPLHVDFRADIYALASTVWFFLTGKDPYAGLDEEDMLRLKLKNDFFVMNPFEQTKADVRLQRILRRMSHCNPNERYGSYMELISDLEQLEFQLLQEDRKLKLGGFITHNFDKIIWSIMASGMLCLVGIDLYVHNLQRVEAVEMARWRDYARWSGSMLGWLRGAYDDSSNQWIRGERGASIMELHPKLMNGDDLSMKVGVGGVGKAILTLCSRDKLGMDDSAFLPHARIYVCRDASGCFVRLMQVNNAHDLDSGTNVDIPVPDEYLLENKQGIDNTNAENGKTPVGDAAIPLRIEHFGKQCRVWSGQKLLGVFHLKLEDEALGLSLVVAEVKCDWFVIQGIQIQRRKQ